MPEILGYSTAVSGRDAVCPGETASIPEVSQMETQPQEVDLNFKTEKETCTKGKYKLPRSNILSKNKGAFFPFILDILEI